MNHKNDPLWVICLGAGVSQLPLIKAAIDLGYKVLAVDRNRDSEGFSFATEAMVLSIYDADRIIEELKLRSFVGLLCRCSGEALFTAAKVSNYFGFSGINYEFADISTSKSALREFCKTKHINMPDGIKSSIDDGVVIVSELASHVVVKPDFTLVGKQSIKKVSADNKQLLAASIEAASAASGNGLVEIEQFIDGYDCSFLFWIAGGGLTLLFDWDELSIFDENGDLVSIGISSPSIAKSLGHLDKIMNIAKQVSANFSSVSAVVAFSFRVDSFGKCWLIEIHADFTGDLILDVLAPNATGHSYLKGLASLAINGSFDDESAKIILDQICTPTAVIYNELPDYEIVKAHSISTLHEKIKELTKFRV